MGVLLLLSGSLWHSAQAIDSGAEKIDLKRSSSGSALTKGDVVIEMRRLNIGRILSISKDKKGGEDCHVVKILTPSSEFKTIHVTCVF